MTLKQAWDELKELMEQSVEMGETCDYDKPKNTMEHGMYKAYDRVLDKMNKLEREVK